MTYTSFANGYRFSATRLYESIYEADPDSFLTTEEADRFFEEVVEIVDNVLPGTLKWTPYESKIIGDVSDESEITNEHFEDILDNALWTVGRRFGL